MSTRITSWVKKYFLRFAVGGIYLGLCLWIGEVHPFTLVPMYNNFPNYGYAFYITDEVNHVIPIKSYFRYESGGLGHYYNAMANKYKFSTGFEIESPEELSIIGKEMLTQLADKCYQSPPAKAIVLHRVCYTFVNDSLEQHHVAMHQISVDECKPARHEQ
jgi:hypothetical protein